MDCRGPHPDEPLARRPYRHPPSVPRPLVLPGEAWVPVGGASSGAGGAGAIDQARWATTLTRRRSPCRARWPEWIRLDVPELGCRCEPCHQAVLARAALARAARSHSRRWPDATSSPGRTGPWRIGRSITPAGGRS